MSHLRLHLASFCLLVCNWPEFGQILLPAVALAYKVAGTGKLGCFWCNVGTHLVGQEELRSCLLLNGFLGLIIL